jgi:ribosomal protein S18 acetylase RimI-like enzyme
MDLVPLCRIRSEALRSLFQEEREEWTKNLRWDYSEPLQIICGLIDAVSLAGFVAFKQGVPLGYVFYLEEDRNALIGNCFVSSDSSGLGVEEALMDVTVETLKANPRIERIESQFVSFRSWPDEGFFHRHGFDCYERYFMMRDCCKRIGLSANGEVELSSWDDSNLETAARLTAQAYDQIVDREISFHYQSIQGCRNFLTGIIEKPGCGRFLKDASFCAWYRPTGEMVGFILTSWVSPFNGHIPQVLVSQRFQGKGIGRRLLHQAIQALQSNGYRTISLSVTAENKPAYQLYQRFQFDILIRFQTSVWKRQTADRRIA